MMGMNIPEVKHNQWFTKENAVPESSQPDQACKMVETSVKGDKVNWTMVCDSPDGKPELTGEITYNGVTLKGILRIDRQGSLKGSQLRPARP
jgi:hypothetical protein